MLAGARWSKGAHQTMLQAGRETQNGSSAVKRRKGGGRLIKWDRTGAKETGQNWNGGKARDRKDLTARTIGIGWRGKGEQTLKRKEREGKQRT